MMDFNLDDILSDAPNKPYVGKILKKINLDEPLISDDKVYELIANDKVPWKSGGKSKLKKKYKKDGVKNPCTKLEVEGVYIYKGVAYFMTEGGTYCADLKENSLLNININKEGEGYEKDTVSNINSYYAYYCLCKRQSNDVSEFF